MDSTKKEVKKIVGSRYAWLVLGLLTLIYITSFVDRQIIAVLATRIKTSLQLTNTQIGLLYGTAFSFIYAFCGIPMGRMADLYSRKKMIVIGLLVWSIATFLSGFAAGLTFLITARVFVGIAEAALSPAVYSLLADYFKPDQRATVYSIYASGIFLGVGVAFLVGGNIAEAYNWHTSLKAVGLPGVLVAGVAWILIKELPRGATQAGARYHTERSLGEVLQYILSKKTVWLHFLGFSFLAFTGYTILAFIGIVLKQIHHAQGLIPAYGWFMFCTGLSVIASGRIADYIAGRWGDSKRFVMGIVAGIACLPFYYFGLFAESALAALVFIGIANIISSSYNGVAPAIIQYLVKPDMRALAGGLYLFVISVIGFAVGPPLTGWLMDHIFTGAYGPAKALMLVFTCCGLAGSICFLLAMKTYKNDAE